MKLYREYFRFVNVIIFASLLVGSASSVPVEEWNKTFGGPYDDKAWAVQQTIDGGYIFSGYRGDPTGTILIKTDTNGNETWNKTFGGTASEYVDSLHQTTDDGYILAGSVIGPWDSSAWLLKIDSNGNVQWSKQYLESNYRNKANSVQQTFDGGYILLGYTKPSGEDSDFLLIKTDSNGNRQWSKTFGGTDSDYATSGQQTSDNGYIIAGYTFSYGAGSADIWLIKTDTNGNEQWSKTFGGNKFENVQSVKQTSDGGYIIVGETFSYGGGGMNAWLVKTDTNGNETWNKTFGGTQESKAWDVQQTSDTGYIIAGQTFLSGYYGDAWLIKTDTNGNQLWDIKFGKEGFYDFARSVKQTQDGGYIVAGYTDSYGAGGYDACLIKVAEDNPPYISIIYPTDGQIFTTDIITISGTASDDIGLSKVEVKVGSGSWELASGTTSWSKTVTLSFGSNTLYARATDSSGNTNETSVTITYVPALTFIVTDRDTGQPIDGATIELKGIFKDKTNINGEITFEVNYEYEVRMNRYYTAEGIVSPIEGTVNVELIHR